MTDMLGMMRHLRDQLSGSDAIGSWSNITYGRSHTVFIGVDERNPPANDQYPAMHIYPANRDGATTPGNDTYAIGIMAGVYDESEMVLVPGWDNALELPGPGRLEELVGKIGSVLEQSSVDDIFLASYSVEYETVEFFPYFLADIVAIFERPLEPGYYHV